MRPILFLDVDGVLNARDTKPGAGVREVVLTPTGQTRVFTGVIVEDKLRAVARMVEACNAQIVVSSSWARAFDDAAHFAGAIGLPPLQGGYDLFHKDWWTRERKVSSNRHHEIEWWLADHPKVKRYAVLDDHPVWGWGGIKPNPREVRTDVEHGVTNRELGYVAALLDRADPARDWFAEAA